MVAVILAITQKIGVFQLLSAMPHATPYSASHLCVHFLWCEGMWRDRVELVRHVDLYRGVDLQNAQPCAEGTMRHTAQVEAFAKRNGFYKHNSTLLEAANCYQKG